MKTMLARLRRVSPLVHCITNFVTANDCASLLLACGARPVMANDPVEAAEITGLSQALCLNLGAFSPRAFEAMLLSGRAAERLGLPVVLDPVGVGASPARTEAARTLMREVRVTAVRGNLSEIRALFLGEARTRGVDAAPCDRLTAEELPELTDLARFLARESGAVIVISGPTDIAADGERAFLIFNGHPMMSRISGTGCQLSALTAAFLAAAPADPLAAAAAAACAMGLSGEIACARLGPGDGLGSFRRNLLDAMSLLSGEKLEKGARYEVR